ncbi:hypothetical protein BJY01DRAFT_181714 [Aspergillus pseudoustus]|uniref:Uncharacterized protein n=1 Tax=Aspergillus pseudoustus TaxID=1810923 RepID=A0ABR4JZK6_9EURO
MRDVYDTPAATAAAADPHPPLHLPWVPWTPLKTSPPPSLLARQRLLCLGRYLAAFLLVFILNSNLDANARTREEPVINVDLVGHRATARVPS